MLGGGRRSYTSIPWLIEYFFLVGGSTKDIHSYIARDEAIYPKREQYFRGCGRTMDKRIAGGTTAIAPCGSDKRVVGGTTATAPCAYDWTSV